MQGGDHSETYMISGISPSMTLQGTERGSGGWSARSKVGVGGGGGKAGGARGAAMPHIQ